MKRKSLIYLVLLALILPTICLAQKSNRERSNSKEWKLVWKEDFKGNSLDTKSWRRCQVGNADWMRHMSPLDSLCQVKDGVLQLWGIPTPEGLNDPRPYITGGVESKGLHSVKRGRVEVRARFGCATGFWPAIWLMPDKNIRWPYGGEIDIMEHLNYDDIAYQTVHSSHTYLKHEPTTKQGDTGAINKDDFNVYAVEVGEDEITFFINDKKTFSYSKLNPTPEGQYPFADHPFYIILSAQLGGEWVGKVKVEDLPVKMEIDYVKFYERKESKKR